MGSKRQTILGRLQSGDLGWRKTGLQLDCLESAIPPQFPGLQNIVPALPRFWVDRTLIPDLLRKYADSGAIGDVFLQFVDFPGFWCNPFNPLAILCGFAILLQFNSIVKIAVRIAVLMFWVDCLGVKFGWVPV